MGERILWKASPSGGDRTNGCPGWAGLTYYYRDVLRTPPETRYAKEGTAAHACLEARILGKPLPDDAKDILLASEATERHSMAIEFAYDVIRSAIKKARKKDKRATWHAERELSIFPELLYSGTSDFCLQYADVLHVFDYKHGAGIPVPATSTQLVDYLIAALQTSGKNGSINRFKATVIQPRCPGKKKQVDTVEYSAAEFQELRNKQYEAVGLQRSILLVTQASDTPPSMHLLHRGDHCRFCPARPACPHWLAPTSDVVRQFDRDTGKNGPGHPSPMGERLEQLLVDADGISTYLDDVKALVAARYQLGEGAGLLKMVAGNNRTYFKADAEDKLTQLRKRKRIKKSVFKAMFRKGLVTLNQARQVLPPDVLEDLTYSKQDKSSLVPNAASTDTVQSLANRIFRQHGKED